MVKIIARLELEETISFPDGHYTILAEACGLRTSVYPLSTKSLEELLTDALAMVNFHNHNVLSSCAIIDCCGFQIKRVFEISGKRDRLFDENRTVTFFWCYVSQMNGQ